MPDSIKCSKCNQEFTDEEAHKIHMNIDHGASEADSFQFIDSRNAVDEQEFVKINGMRGYNPNPNSDFYNNKIFRKGSSTERNSILGESYANEYNDSSPEIIALNKLIPSYGSVNDHDLELLRIAQNIYYEVSNNGGINWQSRSRSLLDLEKLALYVNLYETQRLAEYAQRVGKDENEYDYDDEQELITKSMNELDRVIDKLVVKATKSQQDKLGKAYNYWGNEAKANEYSAKFERSAGSMKIGGKPVKKIWESFQGWYWYGIEDQGDGTWYGYVQGFENEWGYFSEDEIKSLGSMAWEVPKSNWEWTGRSDSFESYASEKSGYYTFEAEDDDVDYDKEDEQTMGFIEKQHTEPKKDKNKELDDVDISLDKVEEFYPTKASEAREKAYTTEAKMVEGLEEEYNNFEDSDEEQITETITLRKLGGYSEESIARELHITYGVSHDEALEKVYSVEVSTNDKVAQTFFGKMYKECTESEKAELRMYSGSD